MKNLIEIVNKEPEYYNNGNIKAYCSQISHKGLNKKITIRHKNYDEYSRRFDDAIELLMLEYEAVKKNETINNFYEIMKNIVKKSFATKYHKSKLFIKPHHPEFKEIKPIPPKQPRELKDFAINDVPNINNDKYKIEFNFFHLVFMPIYIIKIIRAKVQYKNDIEEYKVKDALYETYNRDKYKYDREQKQYDDKLEQYNKSIEKEDQRVEAHNNNILNILSKYENGDEEATISYIKKAYDVRNKSYMDIQLEMNYDASFSKEDLTLTVDFELPNEELFPKEKEYKLVKSKKTLTSKPIKEKELNELIIQSCYNLYISMLNDLISIDYSNTFKYIILNGFYCGIDKRIGKEFKSCIMTSKVDVEKFKEINLDLIDSKECFKYLKGKGVPNPINIVQIEPIRFVNKEQFKLIESNNVLAHLSIDTNLAAMHWKDFETLIKDVFELEFSKQNIEIRSTQHTNDGGIDVIAFNNNPYTGGIILLQAKRYTSTVSPEPVRALKGTMQDVNAIRGILVTTSKFGKSSYDFARQNNITLINGDELVQMLSNHGYDFHVDLKQAKELNKVENRQHS